jgi:LAO/AO transport system kinase
MIEQILQGDIRAIGRAATAIENGTAEGRELVGNLRSHARSAKVIGVTGPAGAGKSTLIAALTRHLRTLGHRVAVISVDPTSSVTQGALLGDRIRMTGFANDPGVFVRSMASRGGTGGVAARTAEMTALFAAAGFDPILVETVGAGQSETKITELAGVTVVVLAPGFGDDIQAIKAGLLEIADVFVVNKADLPGADEVIRDLSEVRSLTTNPLKADRAKICRSIAIEDSGIQEIWSAINAVEPWAHPKGRAAIEIDHLGIAVESIAAAQAFYEGVLGFEMAPPETVAQEKVRVAMLPASPARLELLEATDPGSPIARFIDKRGPGLHHIALRVDDLWGTLERLKHSGAVLLNDPRAGAGGHVYVFVHPRSTGGVLLELIQK